MGMPTDMPRNAGETDRWFGAFWRHLAQTRLAPWVEPLEHLGAARMDPAAHGDLPRWMGALERLPPVPRRGVELGAPCVGVGSGSEPARSPVQLNSAWHEQLRQLLDVFHPWRKGPFCLHGLRIDAEWRSDWKWARLAEAIAPLSGRLVLDVGCGNGYYGYRALGAGARLVMGIDPSLRFVMQFLAVNRFIGAEHLAVLPLADDDLPADMSGFDTLFSMGVLYHRRDAMRHLARLRDLLRPGGELVLETLILAGDGRRVLAPPGRYAKMRNVYAIPTLERLRDQLAACGLRRIRTIDQTWTTVAEQRATPWMRFQSLRDFLDPADPRRTVEGHPAPCRAILLAER